MSVRRKKKNKHRGKPLRSSLRPESRTVQRRQRETHTFHRKPLNTRNGAIGGVARTRVESDTLRKSDVKRRRRSTGNDSVLTARRRRARREKTFLWTGRRRPMIIDRRSGRELFTKCLRFRDPCRQRAFRKAESAISEYGSPGAGRIPNGTFRFVFVRHRAKRSGRALDAFDEFFRGTERRFPSSSARCRRANIERPLCNPTFVRRPIKNVHTVV